RPARVEIRASRQRTRMQEGRETFPIDTAGRVPTMNKVMTVLTWVVVVALGWTGSELYKEYVPGMRESVAKRAQNYEDAWKEAASKPATVLPPSASEYVDQSPPWQHKKLRKKLAELDAHYQPNHQREVDHALAAILTTFTDDWEQALADSDD